MNTDQTSWQLREILRPDTNGEQESIDRLRGRVDALLDHGREASDIEGNARLSRPQFAGRRTGRVRSRRIVAVTAMGFALIAGVAVAADRGILFSDKPTVDRIEVLGTDAPESSRIPDAKAQSYTTLAWPIPDDKGEPLSDENARILIDYKDDVRAVQIVAVPTTKGHLCYGVTSAPVGESLAQNAQMCGGFRPGWPLIESARGINEAVDYYYGIAADEVDQVKFLIGDKTYEATMGSNSYVWAPPEASRANAVEVVFDDGSIARRSLGADNSNDPYQQPYIVRLGK